MYLAGRLPRQSFWLFVIAQTTAYHWYAKVADRWTLRMPLHMRPFASPGLADGEPTRPANGRHATMMDSAHATPPPLFYEQEVLSRRSSKLPYERSRWFFNAAAACSGLRVAIHAEGSEASGHACRAFSRRASRQRRSAICKSRCRARGSLPYRHLSRVEQKRAATNPASVDATPSSYRFAEKTRLLSAFQNAEDTSRGSDFANAGG